ncbi:unnamed protein product [Arctogadus glacialis]
MHRTQELFSQSKPFYHFSPDSVRLRYTSNSTTCSSCTVKLPGSVPSGNSSVTFPFLRWMLRYPLLCPETHNGAFPSGTASKRTQQISFLSEPPSWSLSWLNQYTVQETD